MGQLGLGLFEGRVHIGPPGDLDLSFFLPDFQKGRPTMFEDLRSAGVLGIQLGRADDHRFSGVVIGIKDKPLQKSGVARRWLTRQRSLFPLSDRPAGGLSDQGAKLRQDLAGPLVQGTGDRLAVKKQPFCFYKSVRLDFSFDKPQSAVTIVEYRASQ